MSKAIDSFLKFVPNDEWICKSSTLPWLQIQLDVPCQEILAEADSLYTQAVHHRADDKLFGGLYSHQGWKSLALFGDSSTTTTHTDSKKNWTEIVDMCPHTVEFIKKYWEISDSTGRIRFMWLDPGGYILPHSDRERKGFFETNVAITNPVGCKFRFMDYGNVPFEPGTAFMVDISNKHLVVNTSNQIRTHIIVHAKFKNDIVRSSYAHNFYN
jgi:hypothetical protein